MILVGDAMYVTVAATLTAIIITLFGTTSCIAADSRESTEQLLNAAINDPWNDETFDNYLSTLPTISNPLDGEQSHRYIVEGDIALTKTQVRSYLIGLASENMPASEVTASNPELIVHVSNGQAAYWKDGPSRHLKYAIIKSTFLSPDEYSRVKSDLENAGADWEAACGTCAITFEHVASFDSITSWAEFQSVAQASKLTFIVVRNDTGGRFIASSFFPSDPWTRRLLSIDPSFFHLSQGLTGRGVLRHELGHILGYRHEHIRGVKGCYSEDSNWFPLTPYDPHSVMHYFCGGAGTRELDLSSSDKQGHRALYGAPH